MHLDDLDVLLLVEKSYSTLKGKVCLYNLIPELFEKLPKIYLNTWNGDHFTSMTFHY